MTEVEYEEIGNEFGIDSLESKRYYEDWCLDHEPCEYEYPGEKFRAFVASKLDDDNSLSAKNTNASLCKTTDAASTKCMFDSLEESISSGDCFNNKEKCHDSSLYLSGNSAEFETTKKGHSFSKLAEDSDYDDDEYEFGLEKLSSTACEFGSEEQITTTPAESDILSEEALHSSSSSSSREETDLFKRAFGFDDSAEAAACDTNTPLKENSSKKASFSAAVDSVQSTTTTTTTTQNKYYDAKDSPIVNSKQQTVLKKKTPISSNKQKSNSYVIDLSKVNSSYAGDSVVIKNSSSTEKKPLLVSSSSSVKGIDDILKEGGDDDDDDDYYQYNANDHKNTHNDGGSLKADDFLKQFVSTDIRKSGNKERDAYNTLRGFATEKNHHDIVKQAKSSVQQMVAGAMLRTAENLVRKDTSNRKAFFLVVPSEESVKKTGLSNIATSSKLASFVQAHTLRQSGSSSDKNLFDRPWKSLAPCFTEYKFPSESPNVLTRIRDSKTFNLEDKVERVHQLKDVGKNIKMLYLSQEGDQRLL